jgi:integral membrane sensor domain MASE1
MPLDDSPTHLSDKPSSKVAFARVVVTALAYFVTGKLGLDMAGGGGLVTLVWMPIGVALAALYHWGWRCWPGVLLGVVAVNVSSGAPLPLGLWIAVGNTMGPLVGVAMLRRQGFNPDITSQRDVLLFVALAAMLSATISATNGSLALLAWGGAIADNWPWTWATWWIGDAVGALLCGPR